MRPRRIGLDAKRNDVRMFEQEKEIGDQSGAALFDERSLHVAGIGIRNHAQPPDLQVAHGVYGSVSQRACPAVARSAKAGQPEAAAAP